MTATACYDVIDSTDIFIMKKTSDRFYPGDRVRLREDAGKLSLERPDQTFLIGTKGSIGVIVSPDEFRTCYEDRLRQSRIPKSKGQEKFILGLVCSH